MSADHRDWTLMEGMKMSHCDTKASPAFAANDQVAAPKSPESGTVVRYRLEAGEVEWEIGPACLKAASVRS
jgi:hypothetical protein